MSVSPQGYNLGGEPHNENPFWGEGEDQDVNRIFMDVSITGEHGTPSASITKNISGHDILFSLLLKNLVGAPGTDGYSPSVTITNITGGHRVTITDKTSTHTFDVMDGTPGAPGAPGSPGAPGEDGISPDVTVTNITGGHRVTITDATGSESFDVMNGRDGQDAELPSGGNAGDVLTKVTSGEMWAPPVKELPAIQSGDAGKVLQVNTAETGVEWVTPQGGGGSASGTIGWGDYGPEVAGNYPRAEKKEDKLLNPITANASGSNSAYISDAHNYNWTLSGDIPTNFVVSTTYTPEMTPSGHSEYVSPIISDVSPYLTATVTPQDEMTVDNIRVRIGSYYTDYRDNSLNMSVEIVFDAHYNGQDSTDIVVNVSLKANAGEWTENYTYAYLKVLPEA